MNNLLKLLCIFALIFTAQSAVSKDLVQGLENITQYNKTWYSGYLKTSYYNSSMHYWFFPSQNNPSTDPVLLWLNGGPGCSSLLGAVQENGPFVFIANTTQLQYNNYSWNKNASVIYLESPPGVGFSYSSQQQWDDNTTAEVNLQAVIAFFNSYPEFNKNNFYIAGESYAGIYIPYLATAIDTYNTFNPNETINFKGIAVGNGCTHPLECQFKYQFVDPFQADTFYDQGMYPPSLRLEWLKNCANNESQLSTVKCINTFSKISGFLGNAAQKNTANIYDLIGTCYWQELPTEFQSKNKNFVQQGQANWLHSEKKSEGENGTPVPGLPPCTDGVGPYVFFNNQTVKKAIHVNESIEWFMCVNNQQWKYTRSKIGSYHLYPNLIQKGYRIWIYSGDTDGAVPTTGTLFWTNLIADEYALATIEPWRAWYQPPNPQDPNPNNRQNGGQYWKVQGLSIITFKGVGHMVPQYNKIGGQQMINYFFQGKDLPSQ